MPPTSQLALEAPRTVVVRTSIARLLARLYTQAAPQTRQQLLADLLRPVGPLALVTIAAGAFGRLLPAQRWHDGPHPSIADAQAFSGRQVFELVRYVEQKSPELLWHLPDRVGGAPLWLGTLTGVLLLAALRARHRRHAVEADGAR